MTASFIFVEFAIIPTQGNKRGHESETSVQTMIAKLHLFFFRWYNSSIGLTRFQHTLYIWHVPYRDVRRTRTRAHSVEQR